MGSVERKGLDTLIAILLGVLTAVIVQVTRTHWLVPSPDYFDFMRLADAFTSGDWPESFKRAPLYPGAIAGLRELGLDSFPAAQLIGAISIGIAALFTYGTARKWLGIGTSAGVALIVASFPDLVASAHGGLLDPMLLAWVCGWTWAVVYEKPWIATLFAALAGATRAEGLVLAALCPFVGKGWSWKFAPRRVTTGILATTPGLVWIILGAQTTSTLSPYVGETQALGHAGHKFAQLALLSTSRFTTVEPSQLTWPEGGPAIILAVLLSGLTVAGWVLAGRLRWVAVSLIGTWIACYVAIHLWFTAAHMRYVVPIISILAMGIALALSPRAQAEDEETHEETMIRLTLGGVVLVLAAALALPGSLIAIAWAVACVGLAAFLVQPRWILLGLATLVLVGQFMTSVTIHQETGTLWAEAQPLAKWIKTNVPEDERVLTYYGAIPWLEREGLNPDQFVPDYVLKQVEDFDRAGARYAVWCSTVDTLYVGQDDWQRRADKAIYRNVDPLRWLSIIKRGDVNGWVKVATLHRGGRTAVIYRQVLSRSERRLISQSILETLNSVPGLVLDRKSVV